MDTDFSAAKYSKYAKSLYFKNVRVFGVVRGFMFCRQPASGRLWRTWRLMHPG
jgi:hypothetical protein